MSKWQSGVLIVTLGIAFAGAGFYANSERLTASPAQNSAVDTLLSQKLNEVSDGPTDLAKWKGQVLVVNFWATWCPPCVEEMPELTALQEKLNGKNTQILGIGIDSPDNIKEFASKLKINYPLYIAGMEGTSLTTQFGNKAGGLPFTVLIDRNGSVVKTYTGRLNINNLEKDIFSVMGK